MISKIIAIAAMMLWASSAWALNAEVHRKAGAVGSSGVGHAQRKF